MKAHGRCILVPVLVADLLIPVRNESEARPLANAARGTYQFGSGIEFRFAAGC